MPTSALQHCGDDEEHHLRRLATYRKYHRSHVNEQRAKGRERSSVRDTASFRDQIAHRAQRAAVRKNVPAGKEIKTCPKARQYFSDPELLMEEEDEAEDDEW
ncbi:hypothetical protein B0H13DRAFT_2362813 [Mycena leptocephala]|nr:hypothetical protein B0H13DRAFT_2362813 [Mycena leptocephala]